MQSLLVDNQGATQIITLNRGRANPIDLTMVTELRETLREAKIDPEIKGLILTGQKDFFSAGLDVVELYGYDKEEMAVFWESFAELIAELAYCPKPIIAAISGHSPAGGCVLALCCDQRIMAQGKYTIGLNEISVGIVVPRPIYHLYAYNLGQRQAHQFLLEGRLFLPEEALQVGMIDAIVPADQLMAEAHKRMDTYLSFDSQTWQSSKRNLRAELFEQLTPAFEPTFAETLENWWRPESRATLETMIKNLKKGAS